MDRFAEFLTMATETRSHALARKSQSTYESYVEAYARIMQKEFQMDPFPVTEEKLCGFLMFQKTQGRAYATLLCYITATLCCGRCRASWTGNHSDSDRINNQKVLLLIFFWKRAERAGLSSKPQKVAYTELRICR